MSCFGPNYNPRPTREWSRFENPCAYTDSNVVIHNGQAYKLDVLKKGNILQYKNNSSNITKQQRYAQIARGMWTNRTTTWATQTQSYTNPNTNSLKRFGYTTVVKNNFIPFNKLNNSIKYQLTSMPITCPPTINNNVFNSLPLNNGGDNPASTPTVPPQQYPDPIAPLNPLLPPIVENAAPETIVIPDGGTLICNVSENLCTGEIYSSTQNNFCNPTTSSDVPGPITGLCYNDGLPTYYPRQRRTYSAGGNKWPQGEKFINSAIQPDYESSEFNPNFTYDGNIVDNDSGHYVSGTSYNNRLTKQYSQLEDLITENSNRITESERNIESGIFYAKNEILSSESTINNNITTARHDIALGDERIKTTILDAKSDILQNDMNVVSLIENYTNNVKDIILANEELIKEDIKKVTTLVSDLTNVFESMNRSSVPFLSPSEENVTPQLNNAVMTPMANTTTNNSAQSFRDYFDAQFSSKSNEIATLQTKLTDTKAVILQAITATENNLKQEIETTTASVLNNVAQSISNTFSLSTVTNLDINSQTNDYVMSPQLDNSSIVYAAQNLKNYFDNNFVVKTSQIQNSILKTEANVEAYISNKMEENATNVNNRFAQLTTSVSNASTSINQQLANNNTNVNNQIAQLSTTVSNTTTSINQRIDTKFSDTVASVNQQFAQLSTTVSNATTSINQQLANNNTLMKSYIDGSESKMEVFISNQINSSIDASISKSISSNNAILRSYIDEREHQLELFISNQITIGIDGSNKLIKSYIDGSEYKMELYVTNQVNNSISNNNALIKAYIDGNESNLKLYISDQLVKNDANNNASNEALIKSYIDGSESNLKLYIDAANEHLEDEFKLYFTQQIAASDAAINSRIIQCGSDVKLYIDHANQHLEDDFKTYVNQRVETSTAAINSRVDASNSDIKLHINNTNEALEDEIKTYVTQQIAASDAAINSHIDVNAAEMKTYMNQTISNSNLITQLAGKLDLMQLSITGLINTTKSEIETVMQTIVMSNNNIFTLLTAIESNGGGSGGGSGSNSVQETMIHALLISETVSTIMSYYSDLANGNFEALSTELTGEKFTQLSKELFNFKSGLAINSDYETIRRIIVTSFEALMRMVTTNIAYLELQNNYEVVFNRSKILDNIELLKEYIDNLNNSTNLSIVPEISIAAPIIELRPEIQAYIDKYGLPEDGVFNPDKLAELL